MGPKALHSSFSPCCEGPDGFLFGVVVTEGQRSCSFFPVHSPQGTLEEELSRSCRGPGPGRSGGGPQRPRIPEPVARPGRSCALPPPGAAGARSGRCLGLRFLAWGSLPSARSHAVLGTLRSTEPSLPQELSADSPPSGGEATWMQSAKSLWKSCFPSTSWISGLLSSSSWPPLSS
ncbi:small integral membrane protein 3 isoform X2 [Papio anubis]|uniref:small integral membrane protein 3 isoform X2 n=1 Tax=Papio anubis TaxID=9555 RepID=UPI0012AD2AB4|nr:small integral membrane protein 3 isoform X2 [Papio anubis]